MSDDTVSLFTLMDIHLSKTKLDDVPLENNENCPSRSDVDLPLPPGPRLAIPQFFPGNSPMKDFLAKQISNTLKAKEKRKQQQIEEEQKKLEEQMRKLKILEQKKLEQAENEMKIKEEQYLIDLSAAVLPPVKPGPAKSLPKLSDEKSGNVSESSKKESKIIKTSSNLIFDEETCLFKPRELNLKCTTDISYILKRKIKRKKSSSFGKVFCSRLQVPDNISVPILQKLTTYNFLKTNFKIKNSHNKTVIVPLGPIVDESKVKRFNFSTLSPGDIYLEKKRIEEENFRKPKMHCRFVPDIMDFI